MLTALAIASNAFAQTAQPPIDPATHAAYVVAGTMPADAAKANLTLPEQLAQLQKKNAQLEATLAKMAPASAPMSGMPVAAPASPPSGHGQNETFHALCRQWLRQHPCRTWE